MPYILVVDDEPIIREMVAAVLRDEGYTVEVAADGREALEKARAEAPALVVADLLMPDVDGFEFLNRLSEVVDDLPPVLVMSAVYTTPQALAPVSRYAFLHKPFEIGVLVEYVKRLLA
jgi:DNA-binding response OmpR family regulator